MFGQPDKPTVRCNLALHYTNGTVESFEDVTVDAKDRSEFLSIDHAEGSTTIVRKSNVWKVHQDWKEA